LFANLPDRGAVLAPALEGADVDLSFLKRRPVASIKRTYTLHDVEIGAWRK
jgi:hypothetical protein